MIDELTYEFVVKRIVEQHNYIKHIRETLMCHQLRDVLPSAKGQLWYFVDKAKEMESNTPVNYRACMSGNYIKDYVQSGHH
jgi:hypothetical protein